MRSTPCPSPSRDPLLPEQKAEKERFRTSLRDTELGYDDLERSERSVPWRPPPNTLLPSPPPSRSPPLATAAAVGRALVVRMRSSELADMEANYHRAIEDRTLLEHELIGKGQLEDEVQRLRDELNGPFFLSLSRFLPPSSSPSPSSSSPLPLSPPLLLPPPPPPRLETDVAHMSALPRSLPPSHPLSHTQTSTSTTRFSVNASSPNRPLPPRSLGLARPLLPFLPLLLLLL